MAITDIQRVGSKQRLEPVDELKQAFFPTVEQINGVARD
jgi:hypothetical protein